MKTAFPFFTAILLFPILLSATGCRQTATQDPQLEAAIASVSTAKPEPVSTPTPEPEPTPVTETETGLRPYEVGKVMIIMYHGLIEENPPDYQRTSAGFKEDLQKMYDQGYRLISLSDLINNQITVPAGYTPVVLTFDDGLSTAFSLDEKDGQLVLRENCAVDIMTKFAEDHPDFGNKAAFFVNAYAEPFKGAGTYAERFQYLIGLGYELGNHTYEHANLSSLDAGQIQMQIGKVDQMIRENTTDYEPVSALAYPYGDRPVTELRPYALKGEYEGHSYHYAWAMRAGQSSASCVPNHVNFDSLNIPRVRGSDNTETDLGWLLRHFQEHPEQRYVSDGNPDTIAVPAEYAENVNMDSLGDKKLLLYDADGNVQKPDQIQGQ